MIEVFGDIWQTEAEWICIPTNGDTDRNGKAVMGAGVAKQAARWIPRIKQEFGRKLWEKGHVVQGICRWEGKFIISFPTKNHWEEDANLELICESAVDLRLKCFRYGSPQTKVAIPRPGCGCGGLNWGVVKSNIAPLLPEDNFLIYELK